MERVKKSLNNITASVVGYVFKLLAQFLCRAIFIRVLGAEYLGLNGLFSNILYVLSFAELGIGSAITFSLYKPLAEGDRGKIRSLMELFRKSYCTIGVVVGVVGALLTPFLGYIVKDIPDISNIGLIYLIFVANSCVSYFFSYKRTLITADQKDYLVSVYVYGSAVVMSVLQTVLLLVTHSYFLYLGVMLLTTVAENILIARKADRLYPYIKEKNPPPLEESDRRNISMNIRALIFHKAGAVAVNGTDSLIMARMVSVASVGIYSNYLMIVSAIQTVTGLLFTALIASVGNLNATESDESKREVFWRINFFSQWLFGFCGVSLFCLLNPFIRIWAGEGYLFSLPTVFIISLNFFVYGLRQPVSMTKSSMGLYWQDRYKPLAEGLINLVVSILLAYKWGVAGILLGTLISSVTTNLWVEPLVLFKNGLHSRVGAYFKSYGMFLLATAVAGTATFAACSLITSTGVAALCIKIVICAVVPNAFYLLFFGRTKEFKYFKQLVRALLKKKI